MMSSECFDIKRFLIYSVFIFVVKGYINFNVSLDTSRCSGSSLDISCVVGYQTTTIDIEKPDGLYAAACTAPLAGMDTICFSTKPYKIVVSKSDTLTTIILTIPLLNKTEHNGIWRCRHGIAHSSVRISVISPFTAFVIFPEIETSPVIGGSVSNVTINGHVYCQNTDVTLELLYADQIGVYKVLEPQPIWSDVDEGNNGCDYGETNKSYTSTVIRTTSALRGKTVTFKIRFNQTACNSIFTTTSSQVFFFPDPPDVNRTLMKGIGAGSSLSFTEGENGTLQCEVRGGVPLAVIKWNCFGGTVTNTSVEGIARSNITFAATYFQNGRLCTCSATHPVSVIAETSVQIHITYSPKIVVLNPEKTSYTLNQSQNLGPIKCSADCNPNCTYKWSGPTLFTKNEHKLYIENISKDKAGIYNCIAANILGTMSSKNVIVDVDYGPEFVLLEPPNSTYTIFENQTLGEIYCSADCKPDCSYVWNGPGLSFSKQTLRLDNIHRNQSGVYNCTAINILGLRNSHNVIVKVSYAAKITSMVITGNNFTVNENSEPQITCNADGFPAPIITLRHVRSKTILASNTGDNLYYKFPFTKCEDTGQYRCEAKNSLNTVTLITKEIYVLCSPRRIDKTESKITFASGGTLNISTMYLAYPKPEFFWYFQNEEFYSKTELENSDKKVQINNTFAIENNVFQHGSLIVRNRLEEQDFGTYTIIATNAVDSSIDSFIVSAKGKPNPPSEVTVNCRGKFSANLSWTSEYNNGAIQKFFIRYKSNEESVLSHAIKDPGQKRKATIELRNLKGSTSYTFEVVAVNQFGETKSNEVFCTTHSKPEKIHLEGMIVGSFFGGFVMAVLITVAAVFVYIRKRTNRIKETVEDHEINDCNQSIYEELHFNTIVDTLQAQGEYEDTRQSGSDRAQYDSIQNREDVSTYNKIKSKANTHSEETEIYANTVIN